MITKSKFYLALNSIQQYNSLIIKHLDSKKASGSILSTTLADGLKYYLTENNEYIAKRIFIMNIFEK